MTCTWPPASGRSRACGTSSCSTSTPATGLTTRAQDGVTRATQAIELANVRGLLRGSGDGALPAYCSEPAAYGAAAPYGPGTNRALFVGNGDFPGRLPAEWRAADAAEAVLVVCVGEQGPGAPVRTCPYTTDDDGIPGNVTFHNIAVPLRAYELRTGNLVFDGRVEIGGASCPTTSSSPAAGAHRRHRTGRSCRPTPTCATRSPG